MGVRQESPTVAVATAHARAWSPHDFDVARTSLADDVEVTVASTMTLPAARLYLLDDDQKIEAERVIFFAVPN